MAHQYPVSRQRSSSVADAHALRYPHYQAVADHAYPPPMSDPRRQSMDHGQVPNTGHYFQQPQTQPSSQYLSHSELEEEEPTPPSPPSLAYHSMYTTPYGHRASISSTASSNYSSGSPPALAGTKSLSAPTRRNVHGSTRVTTKTSNASTKTSVLPFHPYMFMGISSKGRTGQACVECRKRKAKCSGDRPSCSRCIKNPGQGPCIYIPASVERDIERANNEEEFDSSSSSDESATDPPISETVERGGPESWRAIPTRNAMHSKLKLRRQQLRRSSAPDSSLGLSFDSSPLGQSGSNGPDATGAAMHYNPFGNQSAMALEQTTSHPMPIYRYPVQVQPGYSQLAYVPPPVAPMNHHDRITPHYDSLVDPSRYYVPVFQNLRHSRSCSAPSVASFLEPSDVTDTARPAPPPGWSGSNTSEIVPVAATVISSQNVS